MTGKIIILDCDGVLLNWRDTYVDWLAKFGLIGEEDKASYHFKDAITVPGDPEYKLKDGQFADALSEIFNQTYLLSKLPPNPGAIQAIRELSEAGYVLKVVSSYTTQFEAMKSREYNLKSVFGNVFQEITSLPLHASKEEYLSKQDKNAYFVEDSLGNLLSAEKVGFRPDHLFLIPALWNNKPYQENRAGTRGIIRCDWDQITRQIIG